MILLGGKKEVYRLKRNETKRVIAWLLGGAFLLSNLALTGSVQAQAGISQGYKAGGVKLVPGTLVSVKSDSKAIEPASTDTADELVGVVSSKSLVELSNNDQQTQVVTSGTAQVLVSTINGEVSAGDRITASPLKGIGMKSLENGYVVGIAQEGMADAEGVSSREVTDIDGKKTTVKVGTIDVQIAVMWYEKPETENSFLPNFLIQIARTLAGDEVSVIRIVIALVVLVLGFCGVGILVYSSVHSSIVSIGRNPLAAKAVHRGVLEVILLATGVLIAVLVAVYMILVI